MSDTSAVIQRLYADACRLHQDGRLADAEQLYRQILGIDAHHADSLYWLGVIAFQFGRFDIAEDLISKAVAVSGSVPLYHSTLGLARERQGRLQEAVVCYQQALGLNPDFAQAHTYLGTAYGKLGQLEAATACFEHALALKPSDPVAQYNLGLAYERRIMLPQALASYDRVLVLTPTSAEACNSRGTVLYAMLRAEEALASFDRALSLRPDYPEALHNRGAVLLQMLRLDEALAACERAVAVRPDRTAYHNRGTAYERLRRLDEAQADYAKALALSPDFAEAHWAESLSSLLRGDFRRGWEKYEWRWQVRPHLRREFTAPLWRGDHDIAGKSILLHAEQGFGDAIQFCRYVPLMAARDARVILEVPRELTRLAASLPGVSALYARGDTLPAVDYQCPLLSLPFAFDTALETIPAQIPYLTVPSDLLDSWRRRLADIPRPRIGLVWSGRVEQPGELHRSIAPEVLAPLIGGAGTVISLQKDYRPQDREWLKSHPEVLDFSADLQDFADTAALASQMDVIVTIDTSTAHLAGALGLPVWIMLSWVGDWRWMLERDDSPWYPTARLYRQTAVGNWNDVVGRIARDLAGIVAS